MQEKKQHKYVAIDLVVTYSWTVITRKYESKEWQLYFNVRFDEKQKRNAERKLELAKKTQKQVSAFILFLFLRNCLFCFAQ